jgi:hypothetical protein
MPSQGVPYNIMIMKSHIHKRKDVTVLNVQTNKFHQKHKEFKSVLLWYLEQGTKQLKIQTYIELAS